jgi:hypothetical protein
MLFGGAGQAIVGGKLGKVAGDMNSREVTTSRQE